MKAYQLVRANAGSAGIDQQSLSDFDKNLKDNLYRIWNRMSSGSYFPPAVKAVAIPKKAGGERILGIPTVSDRIAQMVVKLSLEPEVEPYFLKDSYGYRPNKSALDAIGTTRQRCWQYDWVLEFDIKGLFDNIDHELLIKAVRKHTKTPWVILYIERWLTAPMVKDSICITRTKGTPQGGVISPLLSNLFLHYVFDIWVSRNHPQLRWCRYADDGLIHCKSEAEAKIIRDQLTKRFQECKLELHPDKTKIIYCKDQNRKENHPHTIFTFLGYEFRRREVNNHNGRLFLGFNPAVSKDALTSMRSKIRAMNIRNRTELSIEEIAKIINPILRGWIEYYGHYVPSALNPVTRHMNLILIFWAMRKYKKLRGHKTRAAIFIQKIKRAEPKLFEHWKQGIGGAFA